MAQASPSGASPIIRRNDVTAPRSRAASTPSWSVRSHPAATAVTTIGRLNTPNADATRCPLTFGPRHAPRLVK